MNMALVMIASVVGVFGGTPDVGLGRDTCIRA